MGQDLINKVYMEALRLKESELSAIQMQEKLALMGFPEKLIIEAVDDVLEECKIDQDKKANKRIYIGLSFITLALTIILITYLIGSSFYLIPGAMFLTGVVYLVAGLLKKYV